MEEKDQKQKSVYINTSLWKKAQQQAGEASLSFIISRLLEMWLSGDIKIIVEPIQDRVA